LSHAKAEDPAWDILSYDMLVGYSHPKGNLASATWFNIISLLRLGHLVGIFFDHDALGLHYRKSQSYRTLMAQLLEQPSRKPQNTVIIISNDYSLSSPRLPRSHDWKVVAPPKLKVGVDCGSIDGRGI